jgi:hypothetical protein
MTTDVLRLPGNYIIEAKSTTSSSVTIDSPTVFVTGNLSILGTATNIISTNTNITDNLLVLNSGETNNYVSLGVSGILIARGNNDAESQAGLMILNDNTSTGGVWTVGSTSTRGIFEFKVDNAFSAIKINAIRTDPSNEKLNVFGSENPLAVLSVAGTFNYEDQVLDDDDIPNKKYVDDARYSGTETARKLQVGSSFIEINSNAESISDPYYSSIDRAFIALFTSTNVVFKVEGSTAQIQGIQIDSNAITPNTPGDQLVLDATTSTVVVRSALEMLNISEPVVDNLYTAIYTTSTIGGGGTGIRYVTATDSDELVSRRRAIVYGIIF